MKFAMAALVAFTLIACETTSFSPTDPTPPPPGNYGWIWAVAIDRAGGGGCLADATFEVSGQGLIGDIIRQETPCNVWDPGGGIMLKNLNTGVPMTLRATAPGYNTVERSLFPKMSGFVDVFELDRSQRQ